MGMLAVCIWLLLPALALSVDSDGLVQMKAVVQDVWPDSSMLGGVFLADSQLQSPSEPWPSTSLPLETLNIMNFGSSLAIMLMNSSWTGPAESTTYPRGVPVYLQVSAMALPAQELYVQSCFASQSMDSSEKSRYALILNKGCATKQSVTKFVSRQSAFINLLLNTSSLKPSTIYLHCSVVLSRSAVTQTTKSCNFDQTNSSWVELGGQTGVCDCCATKCRGPPYIEGLFQETKAIVSTGPLHIKEQGETQPSWSTPSSTAASQSGASAISDGHLLVTGTSSRASVSGKPSRFSHPAVADMIFSLSQNLGDALPLLLPGIGMVQTNQILEMGIGIPRMKGITTVDWSSLKNGQTGSMISEAPSMESLELKPQTPQLGDMSELYMSDAPVLTGQVPQEELRGDVFMNYKWPQMESLQESTDKRLDDFAIPLQNQDVPENTKGNAVAEKVKDKLAKPDSQHSKLTFIHASDGSSSLSYEAGERILSMTDKGADKTRLELAQDGGNAGMERPNKLEKEVQSLLDILRGLNKMVTGQ